VGCPEDGGPREGKAEQKSHQTGSVIGVCRGGGGEAAACECGSWQVNVSHELAGEIKAKIRGLTGTANHYKQRSRTDSL